MRRKKPNILHYTTKWVYGICQEPYLVHVVFKNFVILNAQSWLQCIWEGTKAHFIFSGA